MLNTIWEFIKEYKHYIGVALSTISFFMMLYTFRKQILRTIKRFREHMTVIRANLVTIKYVVKTRVQNIFRRISKFFLKGRSKIFFFLFYLPYISFFIFLVVSERMAEADIAFKYIIFPLYFAIPIVFKNTFDKMESLIEKLEDDTSSKKMVNRKNSKFASDEEIKTVTKQIDMSKDRYPFSGIPLLTDGGKYAFVEYSDSHSLIIGSTGCGKTRRFVLPLLNILAGAGESFIATDPKGELYKMTKKTLNARGYEIIVLNFREPDKGDSWNPLQLPYTYYASGLKDKAAELLNDLALNIIYNKNSPADPFWENSAVDFFVGLALALFEDAENIDQVNFSSIYNMCRIGEISFADRKIINRYFDQKNENDLASISVGGTIYAPSETRASIISVFSQKIRVFNANQKLLRMLSSSSFELTELPTKKTALFIIIQDEKSIYHPLASAFLKQSYEVLIDSANSNNSGKLSVRFNYVLDEFANLPPLVDMDNIITASRSREIRMYLIIQGMKQLNSAYGDNIAEVIKGNCDYWYYMLSKELNLLKEISELCGTTENEESPSILRNPAPLITISELQLLKIGEVLVLQKRLSPYFTFLDDISKYKLFNSDLSDEPNYKFHKEPQMFSIRRYVVFALLGYLRSNGYLSEVDEERIKKNSFGDIAREVEEKVIEVFQKAKTRKEKQVSDAGVDIGS